MNELEEKLICAFSDIGGQVGDIIRCMVEQEIASHMSRITQLNSMLSGNTCASTPSQSNLLGDTIPTV